MKRYISLLGFLTLLITANCTDSVNRQTTDDPQATEPDEMLEKFLDTLENEGLSSACQFIKDLCDVLEGKACTIYKEHCSELIPPDTKPDAGASQNPNGIPPEITPDASVDKDPNGGEPNPTPPSDLPNQGCNFDWNQLKSQSIKEKIVLPAPENNSKEYIKCNLSLSDSVVRIGSYRTTVWTGEAFKGNFCTITSHDAKSLVVNIQSTGGFDTGIGVSAQTKSGGLRVDDIHPDAIMSARLDQNFIIPEQKWGPFWKAGPKLSTTPCPSPSQCPDIWESGWHENYVIETSSWTVEEVNNMLAKGTYLGETQQDGAVYKHYLRDHPTHGKWKQFWAVRQTFRSSGAVHVKPIYAFWRKHGLPNDYVSWPKYNIELHTPPEGGWCGTIKMSDFKSPADWKQNK